MSKRPATDEVAPVAIKKVHFEPHLMGHVSTLEEMDIKVLQFQNKKLAQVKQTQQQQHRMPPRALLLMPLSLHLFSESSNVCGLRPS